MKISRSLVLLGGIAFGSTEGHETNPILPTPNADQRCFIASDVVFLQDTTGSFQDDMPHVHAQIPGLIKEVARLFPGTKFGVAEFRDKPYFPIGELDDFCYKLRYGQLTDNAEMLQFAYDILDPSGGGDFYESHYQAGIDVVTDPNVGWRPLIGGAYQVKGHVPADPVKVAEEMVRWKSGVYEAAGARVVVMITDAEPHVPGDMAMCAPGAPGWEPSWNCPQNLPPNPGHTIDNDPMIACRDYDFASEDQFVKAAVDQNVIMLFLTTEDVAPYFRTLNEEKFGMPPSFQQTISTNSDNIASALIEALKAVSEVACENFTTTTPTPPSSAAPTTATSPTTVATTLAPTTTTPAGTNSSASSPSAETNLSTAGGVQTATTTASEHNSTKPVRPTHCPCSPCHPGHHCDPCHCDDLVVKVGPSIKRLKLQYNN